MNFSKKQISHYQWSGFPYNYSCFKVHYGLGVPVNYAEKSPAPRTLTALGDILFSENAVQHLFSEIFHDS